MIGAGLVVLAGVVVLVALRTLFFAPPGLAHINRPIFTGRPYERGWLCTGKSCRALFQYDQNANPCPYCGERSDPTTVQVLRAGRFWAPWTWGSLRIRKYVRSRGEGF